MTVIMLTMVTMCNYILTCIKDILLYNAFATFETVGENERSHVS